MADKSIDQLNAAEKIYATDLFVLQQSGSAKKLTGQVLLNWLTAAADGHGGIKSIEKLSTSGLVDTYRITLADTTTFDFVVTNGRSITGISKTGTSGLVDTYTISYNNGTTSKFTVTNGEKGDKGDNTYTWVKYASQEPTEASHSMGDIPDDWRGEYNGPLAEAPTDWKQYKWYKIKGEKGDTGAAATQVNKSVTYQVSDSGIIIPSGSWGSSIPVVSQGKYLWTKTEVQFNTGDPIVSYSVSRMGIDGSGSVSSVADVSPDTTGNVALTAADVGALAVSGGDMTGAIDMNGQPIFGLNDPTENTQAARKGYVDTAKEEAKAYTDASVRKAAPRNLLDNSDFRNPVNQRGQTSYTNKYGIDRWRVWNSDTLTVNSGYITVNGHVFQYFLPSEVQNSVHTLAAKKTDGSILLYTKNPHEPYSVADNGLGLGLDSNVVFSMPSGSYLWAALYEGEYTAATLPEYHPKGYGAELAECKRYYQKLFSVGNFGLEKNYVCGFPFEVEFRAVPTVNVTSLIDMQEWVERNVTSVVTNATGVKYIYSDNCKSVIHLVEGYATADM